MKKIIKKLISCVVALAMSLTITNSMASCEKVPPYECGDFTYRLVSPEHCKCELEEKHAAIIGLTELGKSKEILVVPDEVDGYIVGHVRQYALWTGSFDFSIDSEKLVRFYDPTRKVLSYSCFDSAEREDGSLPNPNLEKVIVKFQETSKDGYNGKVYNRKTPFQSGKHWYALHKYTNVSYWLNYESENLGLYWVDDFDYGTAITYIPENPIREGYIFDGWYKEPECINEWDFETDTLPQAKYNEQEEEIHQETKLYAKWIEN